MSDIATTVQSVKLIAQQLTESSQVLVVTNPEFPIAQFASGYAVDEAPSAAPVTEELTASVEEHFEEMNEEQPITVEEDNTSMVDLVAAALGKIQYNVANVVIPGIDSMVRDFNERQKVSTSADVRADFFRYDAVHSEPRLTSHLQNYANVNPQPNYRTFILPAQGVEQIIEMVSINNPHAEREQITEWLLKVEPETISRTYSDLFNRNKALTVGELSFVVGTNAPFNVDALLLAYFLCGHLGENPSEPVGESVTYEEWVHVMRMLHEMLGAYLLRAYQRRAEDQRNGVFILRSEASNAVENRRLVVWLNGDVEAQWKAAKGDLAAVMGSALETEGTQTLARLEERKPYFIQKFQSVYPLIQQAAADNAERSRRKDMIESFFEQAQTGTLAEMQVDGLREKIVDAIRKVRPEQLENEFLAFGSLICQIYFPESTYWDYMCLMDQFSQKDPNISRRELSTQALLSLYAVWAGSQIQVDRFKPDAMEVAPQPLEEPTGDEAESAIADAATGEGPLAEDAAAADGEESEESTGDEAEADTSEDDEQTV
jgi:hypothetical protein